MAVGFKPGDKVVFRDDATTEGQPIGELFRRLVWTVVDANETEISIETNYLRSHLTMHTLTHKMRHHTPLS